jgi:tetratricopeptide (TPR) repeat protein
MKYKPPPFEEFAQDEQKKRAREICKRAARLCEKKLFEEALKFANQAVELAPDEETESECLTQQGWALICLHKFEDALVAMRRAVDLMPELALVHLYLGVALASAGEWSKALDEYEKASRLWREEHKPGKTGKAVKVDDSFDVFDFEYLCDSVYPHLSESELKSQIEKLRKELTAGASDQLKTKLAMAYIYLVSMLMERGADEEALEHVNRWLEAGPLLGDNHKTREAAHHFCEHWARRRADDKKYNSALMYYEKASNLDPDPDKTYYEARRFLLRLASDNTVEASIAELAKLPEVKLKKFAKWWTAWGLWPDTNTDAVPALLQIAVAALEGDRDAVIERIGKIPEEDQKKFGEFFRKLKPDIDWPPVKRG